MAKILLVDDEPGILAVLTGLLETEGHEVVSAPDGQRAKDLVSADEFSLMISDIRMRPINGMQLLDFARGICPNMSVIMLTAYGQVETAVEALQLGAFDYVKKPFKAEDLLATVQRALECRDFNMRQDKA